MRSGLTVARQALAARLLGRRTPLLVAAAVTHRCDGACIYCRRSSSRDPDLSTGRWLDLIRGMSLAGTWRLSLTGGEPLMREDIGRLVHEALDLGLHVNLNTNGFRLSRRLAEVVRVHSMTVSFDGPAPVMDALRGPGSHERAVEGIRAARDAGVPVSLHATLSSLNVHRVEDIVREARSLGTRVGFGPVRPVPLGDRAPSLVPGAEDFRSAIRTLAHLRRTDRTILNSRPGLEHLSHWPEPRALPCSAGRVYARIEADGTMHACGDEVLSEGITTEGGFREAFERLAPSGCDRCWCDTRVEMNLAWGLRPRAVAGALLR